MKTAKSRMPDTRPTTPKPINESATSSLRLAMHDWLGRPASIDRIQEKRAGLQMPAQLYSTSKKSIQSFISGKSNCSRKFLANW